MIVSHKHKYIFVKTTKTASTSTEIFFENLSFSHEPKHVQPELINKEGIIGCRAHSPKGKWLAHHKLPKIKKLLNNDKMFNEYFKFSVTRNPWDRAISAYHHLVWNQQLYPGMSFKDYVLKKKNKVVPPIKFFFKSYIDDVHFIRYENLKKDIEYVCKKLGLDYDTNNLGTYKHEYRKSSKHKHYTEYYDDETKKIVAEGYADDIKYFGYEFGG